MFKEALSRLVAIVPDKFRYYYYYRLLGSIIFPEIVHIENTNACNAKCIMCARDNMDRKVGFMELELFKKIIDECASKKELKEVYLHGFGEPLLDKKLLDRIKYAKEKKIRKVYFVTNASLLTSEYAEALLKTEIDMIKFSVYGNSPETFEAIHKGLKFQTVEENILGFLELRKRRRQTKPSIKMQFLPLDINLHEKSDYMRKWTALIDKNCGDTIEEFEIHNWVYGRNYHNMSSAPRAKKSCGIPFISVQILWNGDVAACCYDYEGEMNFGNIKNTTVSQTWNGEQFRKFRKLHRKSEFDELSVCKMCDQLR